MWGAICRLGASSLAALFALAACQAERRAEVATERPNVVIILADDLGYGDLGCYNASSKVPTPHMDAIASGGMRFSDAHSPSAVCSPTRYGLLTGRYAWRTRLKQGVLWGESRLLIDPERVTLADLFSEAGYATGAFGKWHLGLGSVEPVDYSKPLSPGPLDLGFDEFFGFAGSLDMRPYVYLRGEGLELPASSWSEGGAPVRWGGTGFWRDGPIAPGFVHEEVLDRFTDEAIEFMERCAGTEDRPFFLYLPLTAPHTPWLPGEEFAGKSGAGTYGDFAMHVDACVGRVDAALARLGLTESTLLFVTSDNGSHWTLEDIEQFEHRANGVSRGQKADIWEGGHRVPLLARLPGRIAAGAVSDDLVCLTDFFATSARMLGRELQRGEGEDSFDFAPVLFGDVARTPARVSIVNHSFSGHFAMREGDHKLILGHGSGGFTDPAERAPFPGEPPGALYDLARDPGETTNLWMDEPELVLHLQELLAELHSTGRSRPHLER
jgi:arylsulfatase A